MDYLPHSLQDIKDMYKELDITSIDDLFKHIPKNILNPKLDFPDGIDEITLCKKIACLANKNKTNISCFLGAGAYNHYIPPVIKEITSRTEFYTCYTPYQPEASQGFLQVMFEFQTMICELTGLDISNASLYDGATAIWEAILMSIRTTKRKKVIICNPVNPSVIAIR